MTPRNNRPVTSHRPAAVPIHRGPQAISPAAPGPYNPPAFHTAPNAALLIDFDNVTMGIRSDLGHELRSLLGSSIIKGKVAVQRAYADWRRYPQYVVPLAESSIDMIMAPAYGSSKKNATDIRLAVDAMELVFTRQEIGTYILLSGDSDFASLVTKLKEYGKYVIGVGIRESSSDLLVMNCDEYYSYNALAGLMKAGEEEKTRKYDPWERVTEAITRRKRNGGVKRYDGQVFLSFIALYAVVRFFIEFLRSDDRGGLFGLSTSQLIGVVLILAVAALHRRLIARVAIPVHALPL
mgnify:CR=1 FL=1